MNKAIMTAVFLVTVFCSILFSHEVCALDSNGSLCGWKTVAKSAWAQVIVEKKLYRKPDNDLFYIHIRIRNTGDETIGFDVSKPVSLFYINQWGGSRGTDLDLVNERRVINSPFSEAQGKELIDTFNKKGTYEKGDKSKVLSKIKPGEFFDYYIAFNKGSYKDIEKVKNVPYIKIVIDGHIVLTNGKKLQVIQRSDDPGQEEGQVLISAAPIPWGLISSSAKTIDY